MNETAVDDDDGLVLSVEVQLPEIKERIHKLQKIRNLAHKRLVENKVSRKKKLKINK